MPPRSCRVPLATGLTYHALEWGADDPKRDHTVIVVHGFLDSSASFVRMIEGVLGDTFHVVAPDMRGHGDSDRIGAGGYYYFFDYAADLESLIEQVGRKRVSLVGHSMGGTVCSLYAGVRPQKIHKLALLEGISTPEPTGTIPDRVGNWITAWARARTRPTANVYKDIAAAADRLQHHDKRLPRDFAIEIAERSTVPASGGVTFKHDPLHLTRGPYPFSVAIASQFWQRITCPTLLIDAAGSELTVDAAEHARRKAFIPHAQSLTIQDAGHLMHRHQPELLSRTLREFLAAG
jgi:pimeloyl-ACP methyl ester carboxylesterase